MQYKKVLLIIMDGWGLGEKVSSDAIRQSNVPFYRSLYEKYPNTTLTTCGEAVGLPEGQMGNSEVGHLNIGAGRIVYQELQRINMAVKTGELASNQKMQEMLQYVKHQGSSLHLLGLVSDGGVHSHLNHLKAICDICQKAGLKKVYIHAFTDGRDTDPKSGIGFLKLLDEHLQNSAGCIASITGRYYAMDRDKRWERISVAYHAMVHGQGVVSNDLIRSVAESYESGITDEFLMPIINSKVGTDGIIKEGDAVLCFNFRTDRCREITQVLTQQDMPDFGMKTIPLHYTTLTEYDKTYNGIHVIFKNDNLQNTLGEVIAQHNLRQLRAAETEKYPHVTFFFSGGREDVFPGESRIMAASPKVATYDLQPEMSAIELTEKVLPEIESGIPDFICLNFANPDMVGHTGVFSAVQKAVETVDKCVEKLALSALQNGYTIFLTADHGNADFMINEDGSPNTAHTLNPVPLFVMSQDKNWKLKAGKLGDLAPSILTVMNLQVPSEMTGEILVS
jgi:2,3-bisphosphoglycerate-independent phosphoglycerate mutase